MALTTSSKLSSNSAERSWRAFYTRPRHELKAAARLEEQGIEIYCPTYRTKVKWSDRWKRVTKPLFTSYIFANVDEKERIFVLEDPSISRCVFYLGKPAEIRDEEIQAIKQLLDQAEEIELKHFEPGAKVQITEGPLAGRTGIIVHGDGTKASLRIEALGTEIVATLRTNQLQASN
jgi:transcription antitermination factor NusG